jgi:hypothetical protein
MRPTALGARRLVAEAAAPPVGARAGFGSLAGAVRAAAIGADGHVARGAAPPRIAAAHAGDVAAAMRAARAGGSATHVAAPPGLARQPAVEPTAIRTAEALPERAHAAVRLAVSAPSLGEKKLADALDDGPDAGGAAPDAAGWLGAALGGDTPHEKDGGA